MNTSNQLPVDCDPAFVRSTCAQSRSIVPFLAPAAMPHATANADNETLSLLWLRVHNLQPLSTTADPA